MINHCSRGNGLSACDMARKPKEQERCRHYIKSTHFSRCMFLIFDEYCDSLAAQQDRNGKLSDLEVAEIEESKLQ
jgi:hypothetical protein